MGGETENQNRNLFISDLSICAIIIRRYMVGRQKVKNRDLSISDFFISVLSIRLFVSAIRDVDIK